MLSGHKPDDPRLELYMVLKELNVKMYSSELYDNYMNVVDATDKKLVEEQNVNYYNSGICICINRRITVGRK